MTDVSVVFLATQGVADNLLQKLKTMSQFLYGGSFANFWVNKTAFKNSMEGKSDHRQQIP